MFGDATQQSKEVGSRSDLARRLLARVERLAVRVGDVALAAEMQLLKRDLARGHDLLASNPADNDFLSVVTLVEAALASLTWKDCTPQVIDALRRAFAAGTGEGPFTFADGDAVRRHFASAGVPTAPLIDLTAPVQAENADAGQP